MRDHRPGAEPVLHLRLDRQARHDSRADATTPTIHFIADTLTDYVVSLVTLDSLQNASTATATIHVVTAIPIVSIRGSTPTLPAPGNATYQQPVNLSNLVSRTWLRPPGPVLRLDGEIRHQPRADGYQFDLVIHAPVNGFYDVYLTVTDTVCNTSSTDHITIKTTGAPLSIAIVGAHALQPEGSGIVLNSAIPRHREHGHHYLQVVCHQERVAYRGLGGLVRPYPGDPGGHGFGLGQVFRFIPDAAGYLCRHTRWDLHAVTGPGAGHGKTITVANVVPAAQILNAPTAAVFAGSTITCTVGSRIPAPTRFTF